MIKFQETLAYTDLFLFSVGAAVTDSKLYCISRLLLCIFEAVNIVFFLFIIKLYISINFVKICFKI